MREVSIGFPSISGVSGLHPTLQSALYAACGQLNREDAGEQESGWRSEQQGQMQMLLFTPFPRSEEQRAGGCQQISGTKQLPCTAAQPIGGLKQTGYHFAYWSISILMECSARASAVEPKEGRHQDSHLSLLRILFGEQWSKAPSPTQS